MINLRLLLLNYVYRYYAVIASVGDLMQTFFTLLVLAFIDANLFH